MKKTTKTLYLIAFIVIMCLPHFIFLLCRNHVDTNNYENRKLSDAPVVGTTSYTDFPAEFESFYNDRLPFRNQLIALNNNLNYFLFRSNLANRVMIGKEGWLFIEDPLQGNAKANYLGEDLLSDEELSALADNLVLNEQLLRDKGIELVIMLSPNKSRVYSEFMPDYMGEPAKDYQLKQMIDYLEKNTDLKIVYNYDALMQAKEVLGTKNSASNDGIYLYHKSDTHWNNAGAYVGARELVKALGGDMPDLDLLEIEETANENCDLGMMLHMQDYFMDKEVNYSVTGYNENNVKELEFDVNDVLSYESDAPDDRCIYVCRDSFGLAMAPYLGSQFKKVYFKHQNYYSAENLEEVNPDVFVLEVAERGAYYVMSSFDAFKASE